MKYLTTTLLITVLAGSGMGMMTPGMAAEHGKQGMHMMHGEGQGMHMMRGEEHGMHYGGGWKSTLTKSQVIQVGKLKLDYKKKVYPVKAEIRQVKVELTLLITANNPNQKDIDKKIDEIVKLKAEKMRIKAAHKIEVRKALSEEQRVQFDMKMLKKAYSGKKGHRRGHH